MKLVTFRSEAGRDRAGVLVGAGDSFGHTADDESTGSPSAKVLDLAHAFAWHEHRTGRKSDVLAVDARYGRGVLGFIENAAEARPAADALVAACESGDLPAQFDGQPLVHALADVTLRAPLPRPPSLRDGYAFRQHVETARRNRGLPMIPEFDRFPVYYFSNHHAVFGPGDVPVRPRHLEKLDYELEAAIVIGKGGQNLGIAASDEAIFGLTIMNDWSARAVQLEEMALNLGPAKGKDFATSLGPWLVTLDELLPRATRTPRGLVFDLEMRATVNGQPLSSGNLKDMRWTFAQILERASYGAELVPGDVVGSGTCGTGCLLELNGSKVTSDVWLSAGAVVVLEVDGLGRLENRIVAVA
jgi:fumarylacetoacetate (FAA) hydrolase